MSDHPVDKLYREEVSVGINTDGRTIFDLTLGEEYDRIANTFNWSKKEFLHCNLQAIHHAFCTDTVKRKVTEKLLADFQE